MNTIAVDELIAEIGRLHIQLMIVEKERMRLAAQLKSLTLAQPEAEASKV